jgi:16S rRNA (guanine966-N2)-methyltransferase
MTRIIGGSAGSLRLATPGPTTRPTSDRVREALFSRLEAREGFHGGVLDLFAGSGALGLEAASRGATAVILVEKHPSAVKVIRSNIAQISPSLPASTTVSVVSSSVHLFLASAPRLQARGVFIDPPYEDESVHSVLAALPPWLAPGAWVAVERSTRSTPPEWPSGFEPWEPKTYGETALYVASFSAKGSHPPLEA